MMVYCSGCGEVLYTESEIIICGCGNVVTNYVDVDFYKIKIDFLKRIKKFIKSIFILNKLTIF